MNIMVVVEFKNENKKESEVTEILKKKEGGFTYKIGTCTEGIYRRQ